ncbi:hypothetical protein Btru_059965 [Bulinus truncatus]|nr:hypothetical protein Btru_059965 [Bulinus truncatus]
MDRGQIPNEDEAQLVQEADDYSTSEPWQPTDYSASEAWRPIDTTQRAASSYGDRSYIPLSSDANQKYDRRHWVDERYEYDNEEVEEPPAYYDHHQHDYNTGRTDDDELLVPPAEECRRTRWDMNTNPYQTPRFYDEPMLDVNSGYPRQQMNAMNSSVSNNIVVVQPSHSSGAIYVPVHVPDYTGLSVFVIICCCLPLGICALIKARDAQTDLKLGKRQEALEHSKTSRNLNIAGIIIGPILTTIIILLNIYVFHTYRYTYRRYP